jgi:CheY-like chemotaxis protein
VYEAPDGAVALDMLRLAEQPSVVLLDYMMPGMSGMELLRAVIGADPVRSGHVFILMSANTTLLPASFRSLLATHSIPIVAKPFDVDILLAAVAQACDNTFTRR